MSARIPSIESFGEGPEPACPEEVVVPLFDVESLKQALKADLTKDEKSQIPKWIWNNRIHQGVFSNISPALWAKKYVPILDKLRVRLHRRWIRNITTSFGRYMREKDLRYKHHPDRWVCRCPKTGQYQWKGNGKEKFAKSAAFRERKFALDYEAGRDCADRALGSDWWEWLSGSRLFHWRWPN